MTDLAAKFNVSLTPVRVAFQILEQEGLLKLRMNRGAIVKGIDAKFIQDHFDMRILLEREAAFRAAQRGMDIFCAALSGGLRRRRALPCASIFNAANRIFWRVSSRRNPEWESSSTQSKKIGRDLTPIFYGSIQDTGEHMIV